MVLMGSISGITQFFWKRLKYYSDFRDLADARKIPPSGDSVGGPISALLASMRTFLLLVLTVTALYVWQRQGNDAVTAAKPRAETPVAASAAPRPVSKHDWAKHSIDRAHDVADQVRETRRQNEQP